MPRSTFWENPEVMARFRLLWEQGKRSGEIADALGTTIDAVRGKMDRLKWPLRHLAPDPHYGIWTDPQVIARCRELWDQGDSTSAIARKLGTTKCSVVGKAHRLHFPPRPSPIRERTGRPRAARRAEAQTLPPLPSAPKPAPIAFRPPRIASCAFPIDQPGFPKFRFCGEPSVPGKPYCLAHCRTCYVPPDDKQGKRIIAAWDYGIATDMAGRRR
jgi:GcrA cell cycle regulator